MNSVNNSLKNIYFIIGIIFRIFGVYNINCIFLINQKYILKFFIAYKS